jgi:hypothetical protein
MQPNPKIAMTASSGISISFSFIVLVNISKVSQSISCGAIILDNLVRINIGINRSFAMIWSDWIFSIIRILSRRIMIVTFHIYTSHQRD